MREISRKFQEENPGAKPMKESFCRLADKMDLPEDAIDDAMGLAGYGAGIHTGLMKITKSELKQIIQEVTQGEMEFAELEAARQNFIENRGDDEAISRPSV